MSEASEKRVYWIEHKGVRILYHDWANVIDTNEAVAIVRASGEPVRKEPLGSARTLVNLTGSRFNKRVLDEILVLLAGNKPYVKASALIGLNGLMRAAYTAMGKLTGRKLHAFVELDAAKDWLAEQ